MERAQSLNTYTEEVSTKIGNDSTMVHQNHQLMNDRPISAISHLTEATHMNEVNNFLDHPHFNDNGQSINTEGNLASNLTSEPKHVRKNQTFCLAVDGSEHSDYAFQLIVKEFMGHFDKLILIYVYDSALNEIVNYRNRRDTIMDKYTTLLTTSLCSNQYTFLDVDKNCEKFSSLHPLEVVNRLGHKNLVDYLFCGYNGIKGPRGDNKELSRGIDSLLNYGRNPTVIIKEKNLRISKERKEKGYRWLFVFDRSSSECYKILQTFLPLVNNEIDKVHGLTLLPSFVNYDDIKKNFYNQTALYGIRPDFITYETEQYQKQPANIVTDKINFDETERFDFVVFYNNPDRYKTDKSYDVANIILKSSCNICFLNGGFAKFEGISI
jgi:hypothetical protein